MRGSPKSYTQREASVLEWAEPNRTGPEKKETTEPARVGRFHVRMYKEGPVARVDSLHVSSSIPSSYFFPTTKPHPAHPRNQSSPSPPPIRNPDVGGGSGFVIYIEKTENTEEFKKMGRSFADVGDSSGAFSECNSDRSGEFSSPGSPISGISGGSGSGAAALHRLLLSCAADNSDEVIHGLITDIESPSASIQAKQNAAMELRLLAKHSPENRLKIARAGAVRPLIS
ncbi:hypothetical protein HPP92_024911 [Vanilla planifolia]|uniref:Uncharacterized protein n=1 Tax=Vanilla planifolia TaxID=51239 RepID=A0A835UAD2_VANPL|nr:hypothetical protein HPP92_024911 [Vanilla planifolia]